MNIRRMIDEIIRDQYMLDTLWTGRQYTVKHPGHDDQSVHGNRQGSESYQHQARVTKLQIQNRVDSGDFYKSIDSFVDVRPDSVYRIVTREEYNDALQSGQLHPGQSADTGGTVNFSDKPIAAYGGSAYNEAGLIVEVPRDKITDADVYSNSNDLSVGSKNPVPLSSVSRAWGFQFGNSKGIQASETTDLIEKLSKDN